MTLFERVWPYWRGCGFVFLKPHTFTVGASPCTRGSNASSQLLLQLHACLSAAISLLPCLSRTLTL